MEKSGEQREKGFGPMPRVRSDGELWDELREKLTDALNRPADFYTHAKLIARVEEILAIAKKEETFRRVHMAIPFEPKDD